MFVFTWRGLWKEQLLLLKTIDSPPWPSFQFIFSNFLNMARVHNVCRHALLSKLWVVANEPLTYMMAHQSNWIIMWRDILPLQHQGLACVFTIHQMVFLFLTSFSSGHPRSCLWHSRWADTRWWGMSVHRWQTARTLESQACRTGSIPTLQKRREVRHRRPWYYRSGGTDQTRWWTSSTVNNNTIIITYTLVHHFACTALQF